MASPIHVVLQEDVEHLGASGDVVRVRPGYARNFLIPRGLAVPATAGNLARVDELKRIAQKRAVKEQDNATLLKEKLESTSVKIQRAVGEGNRMYGSVTAKDIEEAYAAAGIEIDRRTLVLPDPIRSLGLTEVPIKLHRNVSATLRVEVIIKS